MVKTYIILIVLLSASGVISEEPINIIISAGVTNASFDFHGRIESAISEHDKEVFQMTDANLKRAVEVVTGAWPTSVSLGDLQDLYRERKWSLVKRILHPIKGKVINIHSEPVIVSMQRFINQMSHTATYKAGISSEMKNSITSSWFNSKSLTDSSQVNYGINFKVPLWNGSELSFGISQSNSISFTTSWGVTSFEEKSTTVGSSSEVTVELNPGQEAVAILSATKGFIELQIDYVASIQGDVACWYSNLHRGRYYWRQDVNTVLSAIDIPIHVYSRQILKVGYYSEAKVTLRDVNSNKTLFEGPAVTKG